MGSSAWWYTVDYQADMNATLQHPSGMAHLRTQTVQRGTAYARRQTDDACLQQGGNGDAAIAAGSRR